MPLLSPVQCSIGPSKVYGGPDASGLRMKSVDSFTARTCRWWTQNSPHTRRRGCTPRGWTGASGRLRTLPHVPANTPGAPKPEEPAKQSDPPCPPFPSAAAPSSSGNQSQDTRRTQCRARPRCLATLDPLANPNEWVLAYWAKGMSCQLGGWSSSPSAIGMLGHSVRPRFKSWLRSRLQPSGYPPAQ